MEGGREGGKEGGREEEKGYIIIGDVLIIIQL